MKKRKLKKKLNELERKVNNLMTDVFWLKEKTAEPVKFRRFRNLELPPLTPLETEKLAKSLVEGIRNETPDTDHTGGHGGNRAGEDPADERSPDQGHADTGLRDHIPDREQTGKGT